MNEHDLMERREALADLATMGRRLFGMALLVQAPTLFSGCEPADDVTTTTLVGGKTVVEELARNGHVVTQETRLLDGKLVTYITGIDGILEDPKHKLYWLIFVNERAIDKPADEFIVRHGSYIRARHMHPAELHA